MCCLVGSRLNCVCFKPKRNEPILKAEIKACKAKTECCIYRYMDYMIYDIRAEISLQKYNNKTNYSKKNRVKYWGSIYESSAGIGSAITPVSQTPPAVKEKKVRKDDQKGA